MVMARWYNWGNLGELACQMLVLQHVITLMRKLMPLIPFFFPHAADPVLLSRINLQAQNMANRGGGAADEVVQLWLSARARHRGVQS
jgi:hypothetical protein